MPNCRFENVTVNLTMIFDIIGKKGNTKYIVYKEIL